MTSQRAFPFLQAPGREADAAHSALDCPTDALAVADIDSAALDSALRDADALGEQACDAADCDWADSQGPDLDEVPFLLSEEERGLRSPEEMGVRARQLAEDFSAILGSPIRLTVTDNRSSMFSFREPRGELMTVRLHHMFLDAPPSIVEDLVAFTRGGPQRRAASDRIDRFIEDNIDRLRPFESTFRPRKVHSLGRFWDLKAIFDTLNARFFGGRIEAQIGWGRLPKKRNRRTIRLGVYDPRARMIRVHPALDHPDVPAYFIEFIVFHEMLHQAVPAAEKNGRQAFHGQAFRERERAFPDYERAIRWEKAHIRRLIDEMPLSSPARQKAPRT